jgi:hypothetical protein
MPANLYEAHRQWAFRPQYERFPGPAVLRGTAERRKNAST